MNSSILPEPLRYDSLEFRVSATSQPRPPRPLEVWLGYRGTGGLGAGRCGLNTTLARHGVTSPWAQDFVGPVAHMAWDAMGLSIVLGLQFLGARGVVTVVVYCRRLAPAVWPCGLSGSITYSPHWLVAGPPVGSFTPVEIVGQSRTHPPLGTYTQGSSQNRRLKERHWDSASHIAIAIVLPSKAVVPWHGLAYLVTLGSG